MRYNAIFLIERDVYTLVGFEVLAERLRFYLLT